MVISMETKQPVLSRYQIGSNLFPDACITHHSAFEVFGYGSQVFYECYVATDKRFHDFEYDGVLYRHIERKPNMEVVQQGKIRVTSMEQTVVDSIRDFEKIAGIEEVIRCMMLVPGLNEQKVLECLARNNNGFLYQKCGYFFEEMQEEFHFSAKFFERCENGSSDAKRYLMKESQDNVFHKRWKLYAPVSLKGLIDKGWMLMMQWDRLTLGRMAKELGFPRDTLEKVCRLADVLKFMESDELLSEGIALKGGTAINLTIFDLPRLSVDIDLDYCRSIEREEMLADRGIITDKISKYMMANGYVLSPKSKSHHALDSFVYEYVNCGGTKDNLKIEINYMLRCHVLPVARREVRLPWNEEKLTVFRSTIGDICF